MLTHASDRLQGPVTRSRLWWCAADLDDPPALNEPTTPGSEDPRADEAPIRWQLVERVRREIAAGVYETPRKWEIALDRLLERIAE